MLEKLKWFCTYDYSLTKQFSQLSNNISALFAYSAQKQPNLVISLYQKLLTGNIWRNALLKLANKSK